MPDALPHPGESQGDSPRTRSTCDGLPHRDREPIIMAMTNLFDWQGAAGRNWADEWRRTDRSFAPLTRQLLARIAAEPGSRVLDIGCGAGELSLAVAAGRPDAQVLGLDISPELLAAASGRIGDLGNVRFELGDASAWQAGQFAPDLLVSRHGVMFFSDPPTAFAHLAAQAAPDARLVFSCFRAPALNSWAGEVAQVIAECTGAPASRPDPYAPGPFAFADPHHVESILSSGWRDIAFEPFDFAYVAGEGDDPVADALAFVSRIGPSAAVLRESPPELADVLLQRLTEMLESHREGSRVVFSAAAWIVTARR